MSSSRAATQTAILVGALLGAAAAFMGGAPRAPAPGSAPARSPAHAEGAPGEGGPVRLPSAVAAATTPSVPASALPAAPSQPAPSDELDGLSVAELERRCALRQPRGCLASARAFDTGRGIEQDASKARLYRSLAVSLLDERCLGRDAEACHDLGGLYTTGQGVARNPATASALERRARELCAGKTSSFCEKLSVR